jgi:hypothetical protein
MTSNTTPALWRRITVTAIGASAIAVGVMAMSAPANAQRPTNFQGFKQCAESQIKRGIPGQQAAFDCCVAWNGTWQGQYPQGYCSWPAGDMDSISDRAQPGATVILPPDAEQTQLGPTQPAPSAIPHPGPDTRAVIQ